MTGKENYFNVFDYNPNPQPECNQDTVEFFMTNNERLDLTNVDCDTACSGIETKNKFRPVLVTRDVFINGKRPSRPGIYCVRNDTCVTRCNTATSNLVAGENGRWSCSPKWPTIFGGEDGGDILVCGGMLNDGINSYEHRLPPSDKLQEISNPFEEKDRFNCTPGLYFDGPRDHMNNEYVRLHSNRFQRIRNNCAKYVANASNLLAPVPGDEVYCNCFATHGRLRRVLPLTESVSDDPEDEKAKKHQLERLQKTNTESWNTADRFQVPYACSPCVASGGLVTTKGIFNFPVGCTKSNQLYFERLNLVDNMPCGRNGFTSAVEPACVNTWIYVGDEGMSHLAKRAIEKIK